MLTIRKFKLSDLAGVMEIEKASFPKSQAYPRSYFERYYQKYPQGFIVAENKGKIIGYAIGQLKNNSGEFISLAVRPEFRQKGIGKELTNFLINHFKEKGGKEISLNVRTGNKIAISFYKNLGFKILKTIKNYYQNGEDAYLMKKEV